MTEPIIGKELGQYKILAEIGRGGMGIVYKAYQISLNREVALKILPPALSSDENLIKRFLREAEAAAKLSHPNIVQIFDINEIDGIHFFAMEYLRGETLTQKIEREGPLPVKEAVRIGIAVADALSYSHAEGIIHRDIKPGNIMIDPHGHVKVTDFGLARAMESSRLTTTGIIIGTPEYMSPEQAQGEPLDGRSDLYSLGIVLYEALTGKIPFEASTPFAVAQKQIYEPLPLPCSIRAEIPKELEAVILKCAEKDPAKRYRSGEDFRNALESFAGRIGLERITPTVAEKGAPQKSILKRIRGGKEALVIASFIAVLFLLLVPVRKKFLEHPGELKPARESEPPREPELPREPQPPREDEANKIINEARRFIEQGFYSEAVSKLEEVQRRFPQNPQASFIPQWIKEVQDKEAGKKIEKAQQLADSGEIVKALLEFNQIAKEYPKTKWEVMSNEKVEELEKTLKEGDAQKLFLEAQDLLRKDKFIEATQAYQSIISQYPETTWAKKSEEEIAKLKEKQARLKEKVADYKERPRMAEDMEREIERPSSEPPGREGPQDFRPSLEEAEAVAQGMKRGDPNIAKLSKQGDEKKLAGYLWSTHKEDLKEIAMAMGVPEDKINPSFSHIVARYLMGNTRAFEAIPRPMERRDFRPDDREMGPEDFRPEDKLFEKFREKVQSNKTLSRYIEKRDVEGLRIYLMSGYYREIKEMSEKLKRPFRDVVRELSERLVRENDANFENRRDR